MIDALGVVTAHPPHSRLLKNRYHGFGLAKQCYFVSLLPTLSILIGCRVIARHGTLAPLATAQNPHHAQPAGVVITPSTSCKRPSAVRLPILSSSTEEIFDVARPNPNKPNAPEIASSRLIEKPSVTVSTNA